MAEKLDFVHLNTDWNADPNAPSLDLAFEDGVVRLSFLLNRFTYPAAPGETGCLTFEGCSRWRWDATDDHAWFSGKGRFSGQAPKWGEFYEVIGEDKIGTALDWENNSPDRLNARHFLFYFRDETLEFIAVDFSFVRA